MGRKQVLKRNGRKRTWKAPGPGRPRGKASLTPIQCGRIVGKVLAGGTIRQVAAEERVHHTTVERVLSRPEFQALQAACRSEALEMAPDALRYYRRRLTQGLKAGAKTPVPGADQAAAKILEGTQVLVTRQQLDLADATAAQFGPYGHSAFADRSDEELEYFLRYHRWPSAEELEHKRETGSWPEEAGSSGAREQLLRRGD